MQDTGFIFLRLRAYRLNISPHQPVADGDYTEKVLST